ncbi:MAG: cell division FtsA domain-containing protein, partial [Sarcina sp.]
MPNCIVGLDIGSNSIKAAMCIENENGDFEILDYVYVNSKGITKGRINNVEEAIDSIAQCLEKLKSITRKDFQDIYLGISSEECRVMSSKGHTYVDGANSNVTKQHIENAYLDAKEVVLGEDEEIIDCIINYFETDNWDYRSVKNPLEIQCSVLTINVDLIICNTNTINFFKKIISSARYNLKGISLSVDCLKNIFLSEKTENFNVAIVDIGAEKTDIAIYEGNRLKNVSFVPLGGNNITKDLSICLSIENELAEEIKQSYSHK